MIAAAPVPSLHEARYVARVATITTAQIFDGRDLVSRRCPVHGRRRVCMVRIVGPVPMRLRVSILKTPTRYVVHARPVS